MFKDKYLKYKKKYLKLVNQVGSSQPLTEEQRLVETIRTGDHDTILHLITTGISISQSALRTAHARGNGDIIVLVEYYMRRQRELADAIVSNNQYEVYHLIQDGTTITRNHIDLARTIGNANIERDLEYHFREQRARLLSLNLPATPPEITPRTSPRTSPRTPPGAPRTGQLSPIRPVNDSNDQDMSDLADIIDRSQPTVEINNTVCEQPEFIKIFKKEDDYKKFIKKNLQKIHLPINYYNAFRLVLDPTKSLLKQTYDFLNDHDNSYTDRFIKHQFYINYPNSTGIYSGSLQNYYFKKIAE